MRDPHEAKTPKLSGSYLGFQASAAGVAKRLLEVIAEARGNLSELAMRRRVIVEAQLDRASLLGRELDGLAARFSRWPELAQTDPEQLALERAALYGWMMGTLREAEELLLELTRERRDPRAEP
jgi:hypothetical protein